MDPNDYISVHQSIRGIFTFVNIMTTRACMLPTSDIIKLTKHYLRIVIVMNEYIFKKCNASNILFKRQYVFALSSHWIKKNVYRIAVLSYDA